MEARQARRRQIRTPGMRAMSRLSERNGVASRFGGNLLVEREKAKMSQETLGGHVEGSSIHL